MVKGTLMPSDLTAEPFVRIDIAKQPAGYRITRPGIYLSLDESEYHADPCPEPSLSSSICKLMLEQTPRHVWGAHPRLNPQFEPQTGKAFDKGAAVHSLVLGGPARIVEIDADSWPSGIAKTAREIAHKAGKVP